MPDESLPSPTTPEPSAETETPAETVTSAAPELPRRRRRPRRRKPKPGVSQGAGAVSRPGARGGPEWAPRPSVAVSGPDPRFDWRRIARTVLLSRALDHLEETELYPAKKVLYQFSARGHELPQVVLGSLLIGPHDAASGYYRSRPLLLTLGLTAEETLAAGMAKSGGLSDGRDIGAVYNLPRRDGRPGPVVLPMAGGVGTQFTTTAGWARAIRYHRDELGDVSYRGALAVALGGEASVASNGFWSALTIATTERLPMLFLIEDNGFGISVPGSRQTPDGNIAQNLASFHNLRVWDGDGTDPTEVVRCITGAVAAARAERSPALVHLTVPRLSGHSGQDSQAYKSPQLLAAERAHDPLPRLHDYLVPALLSEAEWAGLEKSVEAEVAAGLSAAEARLEPDASQVQEDMWAPRQAVAESAPETAGARLNMVAAIRRTLEAELRHNPRLLIFGEDVGPKGGVHTATQGLQSSFGPRRVFDTSLSEEGIIGSAVGLALAGLRPVAEIQFRKYADPAAEQLHDCGTLRWRTRNRFSAPVVVRMPGGFFKCGDPWHSHSGEVEFVHGFGWQVLFPSNAADAVGLLRTALRSDNPSIFFEHRNLLDSGSARRPYPGDEYQIPLGKAACLQTGSDLTVVTWGAMVERCVAAAEEFPGQVEILDLRTLMPWDREAVLASVGKTTRCLIVHEDTLTAGFGAEIAAVLAKEAFFSLDAPIERLAVPDVPLPYNARLMESLLPRPETIRAAIARLIGG